MAKSEIYSFRLHPSDDRERDAIEIIKQLQAEGWSVRDIVTDAVLYAKGRTPEMYKYSDDHISRGYIENTLEGFAQHIISELRTNGFVTSESEQGKQTPFGNDEDEDMARNLANGFLARRKRG